LFASHHGESWSMVVDDLRDDLCDVKQRPANASERARSLESVIGYGA
jgi:hypothetical protein